MAAYLKTAATLLKLRIGIAIAASALAGMAAAQGAAPGWFRTIALALAVVGASGAAGKKKRNEKIEKEKKKRNL